MIQHVPAEKQHFDIRSMRWTVNLSPKKKIELCLDQALNLKSAISYKAALDKNRDATGIQTVEWGRKK